MQCSYHYLAIDKKSSLKVIDPSASIRSVCPLLKPPVIVYSDRPDNTHVEIRQQTLLPSLITGNPLSVYLQKIARALSQLLRRSVNGEPLFIRYAALWRYSSPLQQQTMLQQKRRICNITNLLSKLSYLAIVNHVLDMRKWKTETFVKIMIVQRQTKAIGDYPVAACFYWRGFEWIWKSSVKALVRILVCL